MRERYFQCRWAATLMGCLLFCLMTTAQIDIGLETTASAALIRGPYIQNLQTIDDEGTVTIRWRVNGSLQTDGSYKDGNYRLCYKPAGSIISNCIDKNDKFIRLEEISYRDLNNNYNVGYSYTAVLRDLKPNTSYRYSIASNDCTSKNCEVETGFFKTAPVLGTSFSKDKPVKIWVLGDSGSNYTCTDGGNAGPEDDCQFEYVRDAYLRYTNEYNDYHDPGEHPDYFDETDMILMLGDNAYGQYPYDGPSGYESGSDLAMQERIFNKYNKILKYKPLFPTPGNHEFDHGFAEDYYKTFSVPAPGTFPIGDKQYPLAYYSVDYGNIHLISLNSQISTSSDPDPSSVHDMATWLKNDVTKARQNGAKWLIAYWHYPVYSSGRHTESEPSSKTMRDYILPIIDSCKVDLVLNGHNHHYERSYMVKGFHKKSLNACDDPVSCWFSKNNNGSLTFQDCFFDDFASGNNTYYTDCEEPCPSNPPFAYPELVVGHPFLVSPNGSGSYWSDPIPNFPGYSEGKAGILDYGNDNVYQKGTDGTVYIVAGCASKDTNYPISKYNCPGTDSSEYFFHHPLMHKFRDSDKLDGGRGLQGMGSVYLEVSDEKLVVKFVSVDDLDPYKPVIRDSFMICKSFPCNWEPNGDKPQDNSGNTFIKNIEESSELKIHPNPVSETLYVNLFSDQKVNEALEVSLWNASNEKQFVQMLDAGKTDWQINVASLDPGLYVLKLVTDKQVFTKKVIIE